MAKKKTTQQQQSSRRRNRVPPGLVKRRAEEQAAFREVQELQRSGVARRGQIETAQKRLEGAQRNTQRQKANAELRGRPTR